MRVPAEADPELAERVLEVLRRDRRWLRGTTVVARATGIRPVPALERFLSGSEAIESATAAERAAWNVYVETLVPLVRSEVVEGAGHFGVPADEDRPVDHPFVRARFRPTRS